MHHRVANLFKIGLLLNKLYQNQMGFVEDLTKYFGSLFLNHSVYTLQLSVNPFDGVFTLLTERREEIGMKIDGLDRSLLYWADVPASQFNPTSCLKLKQRCFVFVELCAIKSCLCIRLRWAAR